MTKNYEHLSATRTTQIWVGIACVVIFMSLISGHLLTLRDRSLVASAIQDANRFRSALAAYEIDHGTFPGDAVENPFEFARDLHDQQGRPYIHLSAENEITGFSYTPDADGEGYTIVIRARDRKNTPVVANPQATSAVES